MSLTPQQRDSLLDLARVRQALMADPRLIGVLERHAAAFKRRCEVGHAGRQVPDCPGCIALARARFEWHEGAWADLQILIAVVGDLRQVAGALTPPVIPLTRTGGPAHALAE